MKETISQFVTENRKALLASIGAAATASTSASAALEADVVNGIATAVNADAAIAAAAAFTVLAVVLGYRVGMNLVKGFIASAAS
ncbi:hypothetical protein [Vibrio cholerae]|uniref:hypothetical protein n=1 Tax=Vibrio cholerae TaxID=666 RepID=UPI00226F7EE4|nr:hypothetical protein [Vibrio cholerae]MCX9568108.1 hypothetical protein [Vibrio cholerae]MCX9571552.1 hypothetical protein [Vibrio cholerae]MCX9589060.1 hypothetical protein [Vibrio cholerae]